MPFSDFMLSNPMVYNVTDFDKQQFQFHVSFLIILTNTSSIWFAPFLHIMTDFFSFSHSISRFSMNSFQLHQKNNHNSNKHKINEIPAKSHIKFQWRKKNHPNIWSNHFNPMHNLTQTGISEQQRECLRRTNQQNR